MMEFVKYIFWILICIPILAFGVFLYIKLQKTHYQIKRIDEKKKEKEKLAIEQKRKFDEEYKKDHPGDF